MSKSLTLPSVDLKIGESLQKIKYPCGCEVIGKAPLPAECPTHKPVTAVSQTLVSIVLDESGSMSTVRDTTIKAYNDYLSGLRKDGQPYLITLTKFDSFGGEPTCRIDYKNAAIGLASNLTPATYNPRGGTPMYDAIGTTIKALDAEVAGRPVIMIILTDGEENQSREYTADQVRQMIEERMGKGWTFVYLGANQNAWAVGAKFGVPVGSSFRYNSQNVGVVMDNMAAATSNYSGVYTNSSRSLRSAMSQNFFAASGVVNPESDPATLSIPGTITVSGSTVPANTQAIILGSAGGTASAESKTPAQRKRLASKAAKARWSKTKESK